MKKVIKAVVIISLLSSPFYGVSQPRMNVFQANSYSSSIRGMKSNIGSYGSAIRHSNASIMGIN